MTAPTLTPSPAPRAQAAEIGPVAAAEPHTAAPGQVSAIEQVTHSRLLRVSTEALLVDVAALLSNAQISVVVVCSAAGLAIGTVTETLLVKRLGLGQADFFSSRAGDVMARDFTTCRPEDGLSAVLTMMHERGLIHVLVVDAGNRPLGVLNARDGLRALLAAGNQEEVLLRNYVMGVGYQ